MKYGNVGTVSSVRCGKYRSGMNNVFSIIDGPAKINWINKVLLHILHHWALFGDFCYIFIWELYLVMNIRWDIVYTYLSMKGWNLVPSETAREWKVCWQSSKLQDEIEMFLFHSI